MMTFVLLHVTCAYELSKTNNIVSIHGLEDDVKDLLTFPLFRRHWEETKKFYNADFRSFLDRNAGGFSYLRAGSIQKMKILVASAFPEKLVPALAAFDDEIVFHSESAGAISAEMVKDRGIDIIVCFGFGHILSPEVIGSCRCINLHGGFLPWNRGPNPNLWSWIEGTPKGVTIHEIDRGADTGPILAQKQVALTDEMTLQETFDTLVAELAEIFAENWKYIRNGTLEAKPQEGEGTSHRLADQQPFSDILQDGLDRRMKDNLALIRARLSES